MIYKIRRWLYWHDWVYFIAGLVAFAISLILLIGYVTGKSLQYNCELDKRPSMYISMMIDDEPYAYDPEGFCTTLKQKMEIGDVKN